MSEEFIARLAQMASRASWAKCSFDAMERPHYVNDLPHLHAAGGRVAHESYEWVAATDPETIARLCAALERAERVVEVAREMRDDECAGINWGCNSAQNFEDALNDYDTTRADKSRTTIRREAAQRGEEVPEFDRKEMLSGDNKSDQHTSVQKMEEK